MIGLTGGTLMAQRVLVSTNLFTPAIFIRVEQPEQIRILSYPQDLIRPAWLTVCYAESHQLWPRQYNVER